MSQRNPMNDRYTSDERTGKTRKSAASAKPASKAASSVRVQGQSTEKPKGLFARARNQATKDQASKNKEQDKKKQEQRNTVYDVPTEEYRWWRRVWWILIAAALVLTALSLFLMNYEPLRGSNIMYVPMVFGYAALVGALIVDMKKVRAIRNDFNAGKLTDRSKEATRTRKERKAAERARAAELEAYEQEKAAKREAKNAERSAKLTSLFNRGKGSSAGDGAEGAGDGTEDAKGK